MVHNGIEYADMQLIAEAYDLIRQGTGKSPAEIADVFAEWNNGELESYLIEITAEVLRQTDAATGKPLVDVILDEAGAKGTGAWTVQNALDLGVPASGIAEAVFARSLSSKRAQREAAADLPGPAEPWKVAPPTPTPSSRTCAARSTRRRSSPTRRASTRSSPAPSSSAGTSTRATSRRSGAPAASSAPASSTASPRRTPTTPRSSRSSSAPYFRDAVAGAQDSWRRSSRSRRRPASRRPPSRRRSRTTTGSVRSACPAALIQGQRDFFGAHTYQRVDKPGVFHTLWSGDHSEIETTPSSH